jgi:hypothetical protein
VYKNHGMGIATARSNNDTYIIDPILIEYYISCSLTLGLNNWVNAFMNIKILEADYCALNGI